MMIEFVDDDVVQYTKLEWAVVQAVITRRLRERALFPHGAPDSGDGLLNDLFVAEQSACDALLATRAAQSPLSQNDTGRKNEHIQTV